MDINVHHTETARFYVNRKDLVESELPDINEATMRNMTNDEFLRYIDRSTDPQLLELIRRFERLLEEKHVR